MSTEPKPIKEATEEKTVVKTVRELTPADLLKDLESSAQATTDTLIDVLYEPEVLKALKVKGDPIPYMKFVTITPELAAKILEVANVDNRKLRRDRSDSYSNDMGTNKWFTINNGIAIDVNGHLADGQHRLAAIVKSGIAQVIPVFFNISLEARSAIDRGLGRRIYEVMPEFILETAAITNAMMRGINNPKINYTDHEVLDFYNKHKEAIEFAHELFRTKRKGMTRAAVKAAVARAYYYVPEDILKRFAEIMYTGVTKSDNERPVILLRDALLAGKPIGGLGEQRSDYGKTERALWAFWHGEKLTKIYAQTREFFPLPEE